MWKHEVRCRECPSKKSCPKRLGSQRVKVEGGSVSANAASSDQAAAYHVYDEKKASNGQPSCTTGKQVAGCKLRNRIADCCMME